MKVSVPTLRRRSAPAAESSVPAIKPVTGKVVTVGGVVVGSSGLAVDRVAVAKQQVAAMVARGEVRRGGQWDALDALLAGERVPAVVASTPAPCLSPQAQRLRP